MTEDYRDNCPECDVPLDLSQLPAIPLHRDSWGKHCPASGRSLRLVNYKNLLRAIFGQDRG